MLNFTVELFIFYIISSFVLGLTIMALSYELYLYCKKKRKLSVILPHSVNIINPIHDNNINKYKDNALLSVI